MIFNLSILSDEKGQKNWQPFTQYYLILTSGTVWVIFEKFCSTIIWLIAVYEFIKYVLMKFCKHFLKELPIIANVNRFTRAVVIYKKKNCTWFLVFFDQELDDNYLFYVKEICRVLIDWWALDKFPPFPISNGQAL